MDGNYAVGDTVRAFHPREFGVVREGRVVRLGRKYVYVDFGPLLGGIYVVLPQYVCGRVSA